MAKQPENKHLKCETWFLPTFGLCGYAQLIPYMTRGETEAREANWACHSINSRNGSVWYHIVLCWQEMTQRGFNSNFCGGRQDCLQREKHIHTLLSFKHRNVKQTLLMMDSMRNGESSLEESIPPHLKLLPKATSLDFGGQQNPKLSSGTPRPLGLQRNLNPYVSDSPEKHSPRVLQVFLFPPQENFCIWNSKVIFNQK